MNHVDVLRPQITETMFSCWFQRRLSRPGVHTGELVHQNLVLGVCCRRTVALVSSKCKREHCFRLVTSGLNSLTRFSSKLHECLRLHDLFLICGMRSRLEQLPWRSAFHFLCFRIDVQKNELPWEYRMVDVPSVQIFPAKWWGICVSHWSWFPGFQPSKSCFCALEIKSCARYGLTKVSFATWTKSKQWAAPN